MSQLTKISMSLSERDIKNTENVRRFLHVNTKADAVSAALGITSSLGDMVKDGTELLLRHKNGSLQKVFIPGLEDEPLS